MTRGSQGTLPKSAVERSVSLSVVIARQPDVLSGGDPFHAPADSALSTDEWKACTKAIRREVQPFCLPGAPITMTNNNDAIVMMHGYIKEAGQDAVRRAVAKVAQTYKRDALLTVGLADLVAGQDRPDPELKDEEDAA